MFLRKNSTRIEIRFPPLLPFAALVSDIERFVESVNSAQIAAQFRGPGPPVLAYKKRYDVTKVLH
jgi:hypothetical protein